MAATIVAALYRFAMSFCRISLAASSEFGADGRIKIHQVHVAPTRS